MSENSRDTAVPAETPATIPTSPAIPTELNALRSSIDNLDMALVCLLAERFRITQEVGRLKATRGLPPADPARERQQIERLRRLADDAGLDPEFAEKFLTFIVTEVVRHHEQIARDAASD